ncbi:MAG: cryptochrome/photolyase family protein [Chloroflexota bacterium]
MKTLWILGDQLTHHHPILTQYDDSSTILIIESQNRWKKMPYQRKRLVLLISAMRHYANKLKERGFKVDYIKAHTFSAGWQAHLKNQKPAEIVTMAAASYPGRQFQQKLSETVNIPVTLLKNTQFLTGIYNPIPNPQANKRYVMETFYRQMRKRFDLLMENGQPMGGQWNFDKDNRKKLPKHDAPPAPPVFKPDAITQEVMAEVAQLKHAIGTVEGFDYAVTHCDAKRAFEIFLNERLTKFGDYEDALTPRSHLLYHSALSPYLNLGLLEPLPLVQAAQQALLDGNAPINAVEGFVRQIIGWREFMYWQYWRQMPGMENKNAWGAKRPLPQFFNTGQTNMACLHHAINRAIDTGYNHHIERLMLLCNYFMLAGIKPKVANDWFLSLYIDAYDWVMPPNVIGMGLNADGGLTATKPYIASANYINKMGDFCKSCFYNPKKRTGEDACPYNFLYWNFILEHEAKLRANPRTSRNVLGLRYLDEAEKERVQAQAKQFLNNLE